MTSDPRAVTEYRIPAAELRPGDLVNTNPGDQDWQEVLGVYTTPDDASDDDIRVLVESLGGRYVLVQLTDVAPVDSGVYFSAGMAMVYGSEDSADHPVKEAVSAEDGVRSYLYTKYELVTVRSAR